VQRLFSTFPRGLPGTGLVFLRATAAIPVAQQAIAGLLTVSHSALVILQLVAAGAGMLLLIGLWTPVAGALIAVAELGLAFLHPTDPWTFIHFAALGAALAMLGPGDWSVDARLFGRKHIPIPQR
jgi:putative oxidoreductase